jgi:hypothetical protein
VSKPKKLPGRPAVCRECRAEIRFAVTVAGPKGPGGRPMPIDAIPHPEGNCAVRIGIGNRLYVRVLGKDESHDPASEVLCMPHFATCLKAEKADIVAGAEQLLAEAANSHQEGTP